MKYHIITLIITSTIFSCSSSKDEQETVKEIKYEVVDGEKVATEEIIKLLRKIDNKPISILTRISNYTNDSRIKSLTNQSAEDGLNDYILDSLFYDSKGNDTLKISYLKINGGWQPTQLFKKKFNENDSIVYWETERPFKPNHYYRREIYYRYNNDNKVKYKTEFECMNEM